MLYVPALQRAFNTVPLTASDWIIAIVVASSALWLRELDKLSSKLLRGRASDVRHVNERREHGRNHD